MRRSAALMGAFFLLLASRTFAQPADPILVSGQTDIAIIDTNGNGSPDAEDCRFMGFADTSGNLLVTSMQDSHMTGGTKLRVCSGTYSGNVNPMFPTLMNVVGTFTASTILGGIGFPNLPFSFDGAFLPPDGGPRVVRAVWLTNGKKVNGDNVVVGSGTLCDSSARVRLANGLSMIVGLGMDTPGFVKVPHLPFEKADFSGFVMKDVYVPVSNGAITFSLMSDPTNILVEILLNGTCERPAPALSEWNLMALAVFLLVGGAWVLGRRRAFSEALPLP